MPFGNCLAYGQGCSVPIPSKVFGHGQPESSAIFIQVKLVSARTCTGSGAALRASRGMSQQQLPQISNPGVKDDETNSCIASQPGEIFRVRTCAGNLLIRQESILHWNHSSIQDSVKLKCDIQYLRSSIQDKSYDYNKRIHNIYIYKNKQYIYI